MELFKLATYLDHDENAFAELLEHKSNKDSMVERKAAESALAAATARSQELLRLYERVYEDNVNGKVTDDWFMRLSHKYEVEQEELKKQMFDLRNKIERLDTAQNSSGKLYPSNKEVYDDAGSHTRGASRTHRQDRGLSN